MNTAYAIATTIRDQIGTATLMSLGAHRFGYTQRDTCGDNPALVFAARILPFRADGQRASAPRTMTVQVALTPADLYHVRVTYPQRGDRFGVRPPVIHYEANDVDAPTLPRLLLSLDYDGDTTTNPRLV